MSTKTPKQIVRELIEKRCYLARIDSRNLDSVIFSQRTASNGPGRERNERELLPLLRADAREEKILDDAVAFSDAFEAVVDDIFEEMDVKNTDRAWLGADLG